MKKNHFQMSGVVRAKTGKGPSRKLRNNELIPAVIYGGKDGATSIAISPKETTKILMGPAKRNSLIDLTLKDADGKDAGKKFVMVKELQKHSTRRNVIHVDFTEINPKSTMDVVVPIELIGKNKAVTESGAVLDQVAFGIHLKCLPAAIPQKIQIDVTDIDFGSVHTSDVKLPEGTELSESETNTILTVHKPRGGLEEEVAETEGGEEEAEGEAAEGEKAEGEKKAEAKKEG